MYVYMNIDIKLPTHISIYIYIYIYIYKYICMNTYVYIFKHTLYIYMIICLYTYIYICTYRKSSLWFISVPVPHWITFWYYTKLICLKYKWQFPSQIVEQLFETAEPILTKRSLLKATFFFSWYVYIYSVCI